MAQLPISPQLLQATAPATASQGGGADPAANGGSDGGTFNNVLAQQMANAQPAKPAGGGESQASSSSSSAPAASSSSTSPSSATQTPSSATAPTQTGAVVTGLPLVSGTLESNQKSTKTSAVPPSGAMAAAALGLPLAQMPLRPAAVPVQTSGVPLQQRAIQAHASSASLQAMTAGLQSLAPGVPAEKAGQPVTAGTADSGSSGTAAGGGFGNVLQMAAQWAHTGGASGTIPQPGLSAAVASTISPLTDASQTAIQKPLDASALSQAMVAGPALAQTPVAAQQLSVATQVGTTSAWSQDLSQKITWMVSGTGQNSAEIQLNPPDLGPLNVVLHVSGGQATALFTSPHEAVREAVNHALPRLKEMFAENGIMLGNASVSDQSQQGAGGGAARQFFQQTPASSLGSASSGVASTPASGAVPTVTGRVMTSSGLVDTFA